MTRVDSAKSQEQIIANYLYGVPNGNDFYSRSLGQEIAMTAGLGTAFGVPLMLGGNALMGSKPVAAWQEKRLNPGFNWEQAWNSVGDKRKLEKEATKYLKNENSLWQTWKNKSMYSNMKGLAAEIPTFDVNADLSKMKPAELTKYRNAQRSSRYYSEARKLIEEAKAKKMTGKELKAQLKKIRAAMAKGDARVNAALEKGLIRKTSKLGKFGHWLKSKTGVYKVQGKLLKSTRGASALKFAKKGIKGTGWMAAIEGLLEVPSIFKAYSIDKQEKAAGRVSNRGNKQLAKSATKVGASVLGYAAGAAAAGAVAGSVFPGLGNVAGAVIGFVGGLIGGAIASWGAGKIADKAFNEKDSLNKTEAESYAEAQKAEKAKELAAKAQNSPEAKEELLAMAMEKAEAEGGFTDEEALLAFDNLVKEREQMEFEEESSNADYNSAMAQLSSLTSLNYAA